MPIQPLTLSRRNPGPSEFIHVIRQLTAYFQLLYIYQFSSKVWKPHLLPIFYTWVYLTLSELLHGVRFGTVVFGSKTTSSFISTQVNRQDNWQNRLLRTSKLIQTTARWVSKTNGKCMNHSCDSSFLFEGPLKRFITFSYQKLRFETPHGNFNALFILVSSFRIPTRVHCCV